MPVSIDDSLLLATYAGNKIIIQRLLESKASVNARDSSALLWSVYNRNIDIAAQLLASKGAKLHPLALKWAVEKQDFKMILFLLYRGAVFNPEWKHVKQNVREFCEKHQAL